MRSAARPGLQTATVLRWMRLWPRVIPHPLGKVHGVQERLAQDMTSRMAADLLKRFIEEDSYVESHVAVDQGRG
jgi:hypothetical protein